MLAHEVFSFKKERRWIMETGISQLKRESWKFTSLNFQNYYFPQRHWMDVDKA